MNSSEFLAILKNPSLLKKHDRLWLERMIREYPWFQTAHLLLAKKYQLDEHPEFEHKLNLVAAYALDRVKLFELMNGKLEKVPTHEVVWVSEEEYAETESGVDKLEIVTVNSELEEMLKSIGERKKTILDKEEGKILLEEERMLHVSEKEPIIVSSDEDDLQELNLLNEAGGGSEFIPINEMLLEEMKEEFVLEQNSEQDSTLILEEELNVQEEKYSESELEAISNAEALMQIETESEEDIVSADDPEIESIQKLESEIEHELENEFYQEVLEKAVDLISDDEVVLIVEEEIIDSKEEVFTETEATKDSAFRINENVESPGAFLPEKSYTFLEWLKFFKPESSKQATKIKASSKREEETEGKGYKQELSETEEVFEPPVQEVFRLNIEEELKIIDRIVGTLKQKSQKQESKLSAEELGKKSLEPHEEVISETLATIYEEQGKYDKAIRMYAKLSLRYPEKVSFFAARIKEIKRKK